MTLEFLKKFVPKGKSPMCGNSICQDRRFMHRLMPDLEQYFHYRNLDVSTIKEIMNRWAPEQASYKKQGTHLAMDDIRDSIAELKFYREHVFKI
jgi:oligoribonuclease